MDGILEAEERGLWASDSLLKQMLEEQAECTATMLKRSKKLGRSRCRTIKKTGYSSELSGSEPRSKNDSGESGLSSI